jgi:succinate-semialdehyde dehydrogenase/glutarate-semialdehyde dehydrogenase
MGPGLDPSSDLGPLISKHAVAKATLHVSDALERGARSCDGTFSAPLSDQGNFMPPVVLCNVTDDMMVAQVETFGPVAAILQFDSEEEVLDRINRSEFGLAGYLYTKDITRIFRFSESMEVGMVGVNEGIISTETAPFGGIKSSGIGREGSKYGIDDYIDVKYVCIGGL